MRPATRSAPLKAGHPARIVGLIVSLASVAAVTGLIYPIKTVVPVGSTGMLYLLAVLLVSTFWGLSLGLFTSVVSALAYNWFHIPPVGRFTIYDSENWVALAMLVVAAVVVSAIAELARSRFAQAEQRRREADLTAELARLFSASSAELAVAPAAAMIAEALRLESVELALGKYALEGPSMRVLRRNKLPVAVLRFKGTLDKEARATLNDSVVPALEALIGATLEREALIEEVIAKEALERSDNLKTSLLRAVSHDLRTPLTAIASAGDALQAASIDDDERRALAEAVSQEAARLADLVEKLLDLSRLQSGELKPRNDWCAVDEIIEVVIDLATRSGGSVALHAEDELPLVRADAAQLERAFANLLENALRHGGGEPVSVNMRRVGEKLLIRVVNRGPGIPSDQLEAIFVPFHQVTGEDRAHHGGAGLGLAIVRGMIEANGGRVWAESLPGQGAAFVVELPVEPVPSRATVA
jgi:two-component system sensor histidine kinase KdpD